MKKLSLVLVCILLVTVVAKVKLSAQKLELYEKKELYDKEHVPKKDPIPYPYVKEADVMWEKTIWREVNLREKMNHPIYFPEEPIGDRKNLFTTMLDAIKTPVEGHPVYAYKPFLRYEFLQPISYAEAIEKLSPDTMWVPQIDSLGNQILVNMGVEMSKGDVTRLRIKEKWYFDRKHSTLGVRIIGMCPLRVFPMTQKNAQTQIDEPTGEIMKEPLFWIYYPEIRWYLSRQEAFNPHNDAQAVSFDDLFHQRRFSGYIYRESNVFENRPVSEYAKGLDAMFEAERIKESIRVFEHDLWEY
jgi:gliding motility associated protien GldN